MILYKADHGQLTEKKSFNLSCEDAFSTHSSKTEFSEPCRCINSFKKTKKYDQDKEKKHQVTSTIKNIKQPYKEINVEINNNRLALRIQRYPVVDPEKHDPPCECIEDTTDDLPGEVSSSKMNENSPPKLEKLLFEVVSPTGDLKLNDTLQLTNKSANSQDDAESDEAEPAYILRIRRRAETWDKKREHIDLEFRIP